MSLTGNVRVTFLFLGFAFFPLQVLAADGQSGGALSLGYRSDSLDWSIGGGSGGPNILSELEWRDMDIIQLRGELSGTNASGIYFRGTADYGWVLDGQTQDSDYAGNNRSLEFSRSISDAEGGRVLDLSAGLGSTFYAGETEQWRIIPMVGYSYHQQNLRMRNGNQVLWDSANATTYNPSIVGSVPLGPFPGLNSTYDAEWYGPWLGTDIFLDLQGQGLAFARLEAHWVSLSARADWNLRSDFAHPVSFEHDANGRGWVLELGWQEAPTIRRWVWGVAVALQSWTTNAGVDRTFSSGGGFSDSRLNEVNWSSSSINLVLRKTFAR